MNRKVILIALAAILLSGCGKTADMQKQSAESEEIVKEDSVERPLEEVDSKENFSEGETSEEEQQNEQQPETQESETQQPETQESGTQQAEDEKAEISFQDVADCVFYFSSGAGAWSTELQINNDGTFQGLYSDSDMGDAGENYSNGTRYYSNFTGKFTGLEKIDRYTYKMKLDSLELEQEPNKEEIMDGFRYISSDAYGLNGGEDFYLYLPGIELASLPEDYLQWVGYYNLENTEETKLPFYGIYNIKEKQGFSSAKYEEESLSERIAAEISYAEEQDAALEAKLQESNTQLEMNEISAEIYQMWDDTLNAVWKLLEAELDDAAMEALRTEERTWINTKEAEVKAAREEVEGGSMQPMIESTKAAELTKKRVYELAEYAKEH